MAAFAISVSLTAQEDHSCKLLKSSSRFSRSADALDPRSDSIDITRYTIAIDLTRDDEKIITADCRIDLKARLNNISRINLDLRALTVDSVKYENQHLNFVQTTDRLSVELPATLQQDDSTYIHIWYGGTPAPVSSSNFGGFYFSQGYTFNIGVSFMDDPHNIGKVWFPCFDNFVERSLYTIVATTRKNHKAYSGGVLVSETTTETTRTCTWDIRQEIPTYLVSIASNQLTERAYTIQSLLNPQLPVTLVSTRNDSAGVSTNFALLDTTFHLFERLFGPYRWDRVGYAFVPFPNGAMEHAMNIAFPRIYVVGLPSVQIQKVMAHELAHHWFGNLVTCRTASEMWLNEGFARYTEFLFAEELLGLAAYTSDVRANHKALLQLLKPRDGGTYYPLINVPTELTYSYHTYDYPADLIHTLRSYMGDSAFYKGLQHYLDKHQFSDVTSFNLRDALEESSGKDLSHFFNDWVMNPGWAHFEIDSFQITASQRVKVYFRQNSKGNDHNYSNVPFSVDFVSATGEVSRQSTLLSGPNSSAEFDVSFEPALVILNADDRISHAVTADQAYIKSTGTTSMPYGMLDIQTEAITDSVFLRVEHHWVAPDSVGLVDEFFSISPHRYWTVSGIIDSNFQASAIFRYDGRINSMQTGWLDTEFGDNEDLYVLLYREGPGKRWEYVPAFRNTLGSKSDKSGHLTLPNLKPGQYALAQSDTAISGINDLKPQTFLRIGPNPTSSICELEWNLVNGERSQSIEIFDMSGKLVLSQNLTAGQTRHSLQVNGITPGRYIVKIVTNKSNTRTASLIRN